MKTWLPIFMRGWTFRWIIKIEIDCPNLHLQKGCCYEAFRNSSSNDFDPGNHHGGFGSKTEQTDRRGDCDNAGDDPISAVDRLFFNPWRTHGNRRIYAQHVKRDYSDSDICSCNLVRIARGSEIITLNRHRVHSLGGNTGRAAAIPAVYGRLNGSIYETEPGNALAVYTAAYQRG